METPTHAAAGACGHRHDEGARLGRRLLAALGAHGQRDRSASGRGNSGDDRSSRRPSQRATHEVARDGGATPGGARLRRRAGARDGRAEDVPRRAAAGSRRRRARPASSIYGDGEARRLARGRGHQRGLAAQLARSRSWSTSDALLARIALAARARCSPTLDDCAASSGSRWCRSTCDSAFWHDHAGRLSREPRLRPALGRRVSAPRASGQADERRLDALPEESPTVAATRPLSHARRAGPGVERVPRT